MARLWAISRQTVLFLLASALFRDGLAGVFAFGAVIAAGTFQFSGGEVVIFGAAANIIAGLSTIAFGLLDDRIGPKKVIIHRLRVLDARLRGVELHDGAVSHDRDLGRVVPQKHPGAGAGTKVPLGAAEDLLKVEPA